MLRVSALSAIILSCCVSAKAQTTYTQTLPLMQSVYSWTSFEFTDVPPTTGPGELNCQWLACWMSGFGGNQIYIDFQVGPSEWEQVLYQGGNYLECTYVPASSTISGEVLSAAIAYGSGVIHGRVQASDNCTAGMGCAFTSDPNVSGLTLTYTAHAANFSVDDASVCPGSTIQFTDASINTPSSYQWLFPGGVPASSTSQNPVVQYPASGSWDVTLIVETADGMDTLVRPAYVNVYDLPPANAGVDESLCEGSSAQLQAGGGVSYTWFPETGLSDPNSPNPSATPEETQSYTVLVTDANGCQASDFMILTVHPLPTVEASAGNNTICLGDTAYVVAVGAMLYQWSPNLFISSTSGAAVSVWPTSDFTWTVTGTDMYGCANDTTFALNVEPPPAAPVVTNNGATVTSTAAAGYQWFLNGSPIGGATAQSWQPVVNGNYSVMITDADGCTAMSLPVFFGTVGVGEASSTTLRVYPQPADDELVIQVPDAALVRLVDASGRIVRETRTTSQSPLRLDVAGLARGGYQLEVRSASHTARVAVVIR